MAFVNLKPRDARNVIRAINNAVELLYEDIEQRESFVAGDNDEQKYIDANRRDIKVLEALSNKLELRL